MKHDQRRIMRTTEPAGYCYEIDDSFSLKSTNVKYFFGGNSCIENKFITTQNEYYYFAT